MKYWHLQSDHTVETVDEKEAQSLMAKGECVTSCPFEAANWED